MYMNAKDFALEVNLPYNTIKSLCRQGVIPYLPVGRVYKIECEAGKEALANYTKPKKVRGKMNYFAELEKIGRAV